MAIILGDPGTVSRDDIMFLNFHHEHCSVLTNCPWVSEDAWPFYKGALFLGVGSAAFGIRRGSKANTYITSVFGAAQPRPQGLPAFQYGGGRREDPGTQRTKTIADWCIS